MRQFLLVTKRNWFGFSVLATLGVTTFIVWAWAFASYSSYLKQSHDCIKSLRSGTGAKKKADFDAHPDVQAILAGTRTSYSGCDNEVLSISANVVSKAFDCAKMAIELRNQFAKANGQSPISKNVMSDINTAVIADPGRFKSKFTYRPVNLATPWEDPSIKGLQAGDMLYFKNENCQERSNFFMGHVMTVVEVHYGFTGHPKSVTVLEGHTNSSLPTYRTLSLDQIFKNGKGETRGWILNLAAISDISCCVFKGITTLNDEPRTVPVTAVAAPSAGEEKPNLNRTRSGR